MVEDEETEENTAKEQSQPYQQPFNLLGNEKVESVPPPTYHQTSIYSQGQNQGQGNE
jgi:hypothetical protein